MAAVARTRSSSSLEKTRVDFPPLPLSRAAGKRFPPSTPLQREKEGGLSLRGGVGCARAAQSAPRFPSSVNLRANSRKRRKDSLSRRRCASARFEGGREGRKKGGRKLKVEQVVLA